MTGPDWRPEVRLAFISDDGTIDTTGQRAFSYFEALPNVGDVLVKPSVMDDGPTAVVVVGRQFIRPRGEEPRWWLIVRRTDNNRWREVCLLDDETNQTFAKMRAETSAKADAFLKRQGKRKR